MNDRDIRNVLLTDGWHGVRSGSFHRQPWVAGVEGFRFEEVNADGVTDGWIEGPLTSTLAVESAA